MDPHALLVFLTASRASIDNHPRVPEPSNGSVKGVGRRWKRFFGARTSVRCDSPGR